ncbi:hypothetical protein CDAR_17321 [Caerostris darwini]|uniref:Uncharacterized protein n=1 Tax=Caerostris darwini TaxID=1538125 RepID=A0AAV4M595_9ARAC|nr:hypothetical protein CDAR_17321 [Caerostris darwini]
MMWCGVEVMSSIADDFLKDTSKKKMAFALAAAAEDEEIESIRRPQKMQSLTTATTYSHEDRNCHDVTRSTGQTFV